MFGWLFRMSINWDKRSEPHTCGEKVKLSIYIYVYMYGTCIFHLCISALFVHHQIFPHVLLQIVQVIASYIA